VNLGASGAARAQTRTQTGAQTGAQTGLYKNTLGPGRPRTIRPQRAALAIRHLPRKQLSLVCGPPSRRRFSPAPGSSHPDNACTASRPPTRPPCLVAMQSSRMTTVELHGGSSRLRESPPTDPAAPAEYHTHQRQPKDAPAPRIPDPRSTDSGLHDTANRDAWPCLSTSDAHEVPAPQLGSGLCHHRTRGKPMSQHRTHGERSPLTASRSCRTTPASKHNVLQRTDLRK